MERNVERKTLSFGKGMTNVPSDLLSDDTELAESNGFIYRDGEMKPVQEAKDVLTIPFKLRYVHKSADYKNLIAYNDNEKELKCYNFKDENFGKFDIQTFSVPDVRDINSVGNTLLVSTTKGIHYLLFKGTQYKDLGTELPRPTMKFGTDASNFELGGGSPCSLDQIIDSSQKEAVYDSGGNLTTIQSPSYDSSGHPTINYYQYSKKNDVDKIDTFYTAIQGHVSAQIAKVKENNKFAFPFMIRYALKLYDGTYTRISVPVVCYPTINRNCYFTPVKYDEGQKNYMDTSENTTYFLYRPWYANLYFEAKIDGIENWEDIVKEVVVFASDDVIPFYLEDKNWDFKRATDVNGEVYSNQLGNSLLNNPLPGIPGVTPAPSLKLAFKFTQDGFPARDVIIPKYKSDSEIIDELKVKTQFFKLFSIKCNNLNYLDFSWHQAPIARRVVENLTSQEQLKVDDYYGWAKLVVSNLYPYNSRINAFGIERFPYCGDCNFETYYGSSWMANFKPTYYVHIVSDSMDTWVKSDEGEYMTSEVANSWFFYPDPNATEVIVWDSVSKKGMRLKLENHPMLNGAYCFNKLPTEETFVADSSINIPTVDESAHETINSQIYTSVVNNPFVFEASGDNTVGTGKILGIVANTEAVSQGQFGQYPLLVFTDEGIYAMGVNSEGLYSNIYPISREVCNNADSIIPTDNLVFFTSNKGLMAISGGTAVCLSEQMRGRTPRNFATMGGGRFLDFLKDCLIAYDYRDSLLRIYKKSKGLDENGDLKDLEDSYYYIYNMVDKTFSMGELVEKNQHGEFPYGIQAVVNDYPDNLIQTVYGEIRSLTRKPDINDDDTQYSGSFTTRPLKLGGSMTLKSLRTIKHLYGTDDGKVKLEVYASNDCKNWVKLTSLGGKPWKYFTFKYTLTDFRACDSFAGTIVEVQSRREDKMR